MNSLCKERIAKQEEGYWWKIFIEKILPCIPGILLIIACILYILPCKNYVTIIIIFLESSIFDQQRINSLINVSVVLIGFYVTIMSIFGSNSSVAVVAISKANLSHKFTSYIRTALISTFIYLIFTIFYDAIKLEFIILLYTINFLWVVVNLIRIAYLSINLYDYNIKQSANIKENEDKNNQEILNLLKDIKNLNQMSKKSHYDFIKNKVKAEKNKSDKELPYDEDI